MVLPHPAHQAPHEPGRGDPPGLPDGADSLANVVLATFAFAFFYPLAQELVGRYGEALARALRRR